MPDLLLEVSSITFWYILGPLAESLSQDHLLKLGEVGLKVRPSQALLCIQLCNYHYSQKLSQGNNVGPTKQGEEKDPALPVQCLWYGGQGHKPKK